MSTPFGEGSGNNWRGLVSVRHRQRGLWASVPWAARARSIASRAAARGSDSVLPTEKAAGELSAAVLRPSEQRRTGGGGHVPVNI